MVQIRSQAAHIGKDRVRHSKARVSPRERDHLSAQIERAVANVPGRSGIDADGALDVGQKTVVERDRNTAAGSATTTGASKNDAPDAIDQLRVRDAAENAAGPFDADSFSLTMLSWSF